MPFDVAPADPLAIYRERRQRAADLWAKVPPQDFVMDTWECGTTACALGWLALKRVDGWEMHRDTAYDYDRSPNWEEHGSIFGAAHYFGLTPSQADWLFGGSGGAYGCTVSAVTAEMVGHQLLLMPVSVPRFGLLSA